MVFAQTGIYVSGDENDSTADLNVDYHNGAIINCHSGEKNLRDRRTSWTPANLPAGGGEMYFFVQDLS
jgi:hypothetical protein